jgi:catechol 2,3-dioxygenase-like lactoylglutathione lyase family enzyme
MKSLAMKTLARHFAASVSFTAAAAIGAGLTLTAWAQAPGRGATPAPIDPPPPPLIEGAHWHHVHINSTDPAESIAYYTRHFDADAANFAGALPAVWTQRSWILFNRVNAPPSIKLNTAIWHIGWGAPDPQAEYERQQQLGATFFTPITDLSTGLGGTPGRFYFMYVESPDRTLVELNTAQTDDFGHLHLFSADPLAAGDWYIKTFGVRGRLSGPQSNREPRISLTGLQVGPSSNINFDNVNLIIYPVEYAKKAYAEDWEGIDELQSTRGNVNDHIGVSVPDLDAALQALRGAGVAVTQEPVSVSPQLRYAFIEGPDRIAIEVIEDKTEHPPYE